MNDILFGWTTAMGASINDGEGNTYNREGFSNSVTCRADDGTLVTHSLTALQTNTILAQMQIPLRALWSGDVENWAISQSPLEDFCRDNEPDHGLGERRDQNILTAIRDALVTERR